MTDPNRPIIDPRSTVVGTQPSSTAPTGSSGGSTPPPAQPNPAPITLAGSSAIDEENVLKNKPDTSQVSGTQSKKFGTLDLSLSTDAEPYLNKSVKPQELSDADRYRGDSYETLLPWIEDYLERHRPKSKEDLEKERRRQKAEGIISGISDAARAVSNLIFTHHYAPNMYNPKEGMSAKAKERFDKLKAEREAEDDRFFQYAMTYGRLKDAQEEKEYQRGRDALQDQIRMSQEDRAQAKADRDAAMAELRMELMQGKIDQQEAAAEAERIEAKYADAFWQSRINKNNRVPMRSGGARGGSGRPGEYPWYDRNGNKYYAHSYEAARQNALDNGTWNDGTQYSTSKKTQKAGLKTTTTETSTTKTGKGHSTKPRQQTRPQQKKKNRLGL